ncbi:slipin family protein [Thermosphaera aggregans]|jgi:regulator of protease activity HflC (stomatin/prohibitin superfamily)|uniref:SPFH domain, Band 7 family protein n=1 Tax=Thermosphaera aggregans (strain DSM 11486 / M11TL) TaxID=633148 RepID=D5U0S5_THEAM|nr:slipin family protein [Thermosphaera aggregans]ADG90725.1 SPFH domain, Band 7 family protein [Thermosphaera aggregans DSM 11486]
MDPFTLLIILAIILFIGVPLLSSSIKIIREYERAVIFRLGRLLGAKGPGIVVVIPFFDNLAKVDLRLVTVDVPKQEIITRDNVSVKVDAVIYYRVIDPVSAITKVANFHYSVSLLGQTVLRDVLGQAELDDLLSRREELNKKISGILDEMTMPWGIKISAVTIKSVELPEELMRAMAKQAEAERWRRARIIEAEGERQASQILGEAARVYEEHPTALRLRELQTLIEVAREKALVVVTETGASSTGVSIASYKAIKEFEKKQGG